MKKIISLIICIALFATNLCAFASDTDEMKKTTFVTTRAKMPDTIEQRDCWKAFARYKDSHEAITLSSYYDGYICATVPYENKDREIEAFLPDEIVFTDKDDSRFEFHTMERLSQTGVIIGNEKGEAKPFDNVTRAEAVAMIMRFMGLKPIVQYELLFDDVKRDDWFWGYVAASHSFGLVEGDNEKTFSPQRNVTREEVTVMVARALEYADLRCPVPNAENIKDKDKISDWAKKAYDAVGICYISDYDDTDPEHPIRVLNPQKAATRYDVASLIRDVSTSCQVYSSDIAKEFGFDEKMPVIDGSTSTYPFTQAVYSNLFYGGTAHNSYPASHSKSHASYQRLINGEVDMLFASVYPASDILEMAKQKGVELELIPIAYDAMIFFTNAENSAEGLTSKQITDIYVNNAYSNWSQLGAEDALLYPYCRNNDSGSHAQMEKHFLFGAEIHPEVQKETSRTMSNVLTDVMDAKTTDPKGYGLGYSIYYYFHNMDMFYSTSTQLKLLAIDGVRPNDETIADGSYPLSNNTYVVIRKNSPEGSPERKMAEFMLTPLGQECVAQAGFGKLK